MASLFALRHAQDGKGKLKKGKIPKKDAIALLDLPESPSLSQYYYIPDGSATG